MRAGIQVNYKNFNYDKSSEIWVLLIIPTIHKPKEICAVEQSTEESPDTVSEQHLFVKEWKHCFMNLVLGKVVLLRFLVERTADARNREMKLKNPTARCHSRDQTEDRIQFHEEL
jgi:hypothetical protein